MGEFDFEKLDREVDDLLADVKGLLDEPEEDEAELDDLEEDETELDTILEMCTCFGVEPDTVMELLDYGYSYDEIEEFLMYPSMLQEELRTSTEI